MRISKIFKFLILVIFSFIISFFVNYNFNYNFDTLKLHGKISFFKGETESISHKKLFMVPLYATISNHFNPQLMANRIEDKIREGEFCKRNRQEAKRNLNILQTETHISFSIIFIELENAKKCKNEIKNYIQFQRDLFIIETTKTINSVIESNERTTEERETLGKINSIISSIDPGVMYENQKTLDEYLNLMRTKSFFERVYDIEGILENYEIIQNSTFFKDEIKISSNNNSKNILKIENIFIIVLLVLSFIFFSNEINYTFKKIKKYIK